MTTVDCVRADLSAVVLDLSLPFMGTADNVRWYHERDTRVVWADVNRAFCDWLHRGVGRR